MFGFEVGEFEGGEWDVGGFVDWVFVYGGVFFEVVDDVIGCGFVERYIIGV